ncbi:hypothetical protein DY926_15610 [Komagataeibacter melaceti]|uniref:Plasmid replication protein C C-terminal domain-containing protein n=1 Tax=Komagataeibacter melaceti TaxID=2766577 RepID=A0A371YWL1_9PROT|nr:replication initiation protein RepC [Komagataeibacter melaceti]RFD18626.1 hypothetical protein DY926_15610 [Komagataeibacter melaceti]
MRSVGGPGRNRTPARTVRTARFSRHIDVLSRNLPPLRDLCPTDRPTQPELTDAAEHLSGQMGITHHAWRQACVVLGRLQASITIIIMAARLHRGEAIRYRDAYFRSLVDRGARHALYLDRSLYALRDACVRISLPATPSPVHVAGQRP